MVAVRIIVYLARFSLNTKRKTKWCILVKNEPLVRGLPKNFVLMADSTIENQENQTVTPSKKSKMALPMYPYYESAQRLC